MSLLCRSTSSLAVTWRSASAGGDSERVKMKAYLMPHTGETGGGLRALALWISKSS